MFFSSLKNCTTLFAIVSPNSSRFTSSLAVALDILSKHNESHIGYLNEELYKKNMWNHTPLTDFWQIAGGISRRLNNMGIYTMKDIVMADSERLYKEFGVNAEILIDHANGIEPVTIKDIKKIICFLFIIQSPLKTSETHTNKNIYYIHL